MPEAEEKGAEGAQEQASQPEGLVAKNRELLGEVKALKAKLKAASEIDPEAAREALEFKERAEAELAEKRGEFEKLRAKDREKYQRDLTAKEAREAKLTKALHERLVDFELSKAIREAGGDPEYVLEKGRPRVSVVESEDGWETVVAGADGKPSTMTDLAKELRERFPRAFDGTGSSGSGAQAGAGGGGQMPLPDPNDPIAVGKAADAWIRARQNAAAARR